MIRVTWLQFRAQAVTAAAALAAFAALLAATGPHLASLYAAAGSAAATAAAISLRISPWRRPARSAGRYRQSRAGVFSACPGVSG